MLNVKQFITAISLALCLISLSVVLTLNFRPLYQWEMKWSNISEETGVSEEIILENYDTLIEYNSVFFRGELVFPTLPMSESGKIHFEEVKNIFVFFQAGLLPVTFVLAVLGAWLLRKEKPKYLKWAAGLMIGIPTVLGTLIGLYWDKMFVLFHELLFNNDYWIFDYRTDPIILFLPDSYFMRCAIMILTMVVCSSVACLLIYRYRNKKK